MTDYYGYEIKNYVVEVICNNTPQYMYTKKCLLADPDLAKKFSTKKNAVGFFKRSSFASDNVTYKVVELLNKAVDNLR